HKEMDDRTSLKDMGKIIENWKKEMEDLKGKEQQLNKEYEIIRLCREEIAKLL
ncbi:11466_t:CDS:1, partial [Cetraspora pellucida]